MLRSFDHLRGYTIHASDGDIGSLRDVYFDGKGGSCALGAAYEGIYLLPRNVGEAMPHRLDRFFHCLENVSRRCPAGCKKHIPIGAMIIHLNDDHHWTREQIADWLEHPPTPVRNGTS